MKNIESKPSHSIGPDLRLNGVVYTPSSVANALTKKALSLITVKRPTILEPSVGDGAFLSALQRTSKKIGVVTSVDINAKLVKQVKEKFQLSFEPLSVFHKGDFIEFALANSEDRYDLIIGNPPFIRKHNLSNAFRQNLLLLSEKSPYPIKYLKNAWAAFIVASNQIVSENGIVAFVVPYEIMTVNYGKKIHSEIFSTFDRVDIYVPERRAFKALDQDAVTFIAQKRTKKPRGLFVHHVTNLSTLQEDKRPKIKIINNKHFSTDLKSFLFDKETNKLIRRLRNNSKKISDYCTSTPGIVTAANEFFILPSGKAEELGLMKYGRPILRKGEYLPPGLSFKKRDFNAIKRKGNPCYFIDIKNNGDKRLPRNLQKYIEYGEDQKFHLRYKCKNRKPWHEVPSVWESCGFFFKRAHLVPRICVNGAKVLVTDTAYRIRMKKNYSIKGLCYSFYNPVSLLFAELDGRFYGGGVLELTPSEFKGIPLEYIEPSKQKFEDLDNKFRQHGVSSEFVHGLDMVRVKKIYDITDQELELLKIAYNRAQQHRLRHGRSSAEGPR